MRDEGCLTGCCLLLVLLCGFGSRAGAAEPVEFFGSTMGTYYRVKLSELPSGYSLQQIQSEVESRLERLNDRMSTWREDSELAQFNRQTTTNWFAVSPATAEVVAEAQRISEQSGGAFDVTVGPLVNLWSFGPETRVASVPSDEAIAEAKSRTGFRQLEVRRSPPALRKINGELSVDLSAIAKGYGVDVIAGYLSGIDSDGYMVDIGGEVRTCGTRPDGSAWRIGIQSPLELENAVYRAVELRDRAMATSGDYRNFFVKEGKRYSHTIDPRTGRPVEHQLGSVSVMHESGMTADALATAIMVLGPEAGYDFARRENLPVLLLVYDGRGGLLQKTTPPFDNLLVSLEPESSPMRIVIATLVVFLIAVVGMAVGVIFSNRRLKGTCGGLAGMRDAQGRTLCDACTDPSPECAGVEEKMNQAAESRPAEERVSSE